MYASEAAALCRASHNNLGRLTKTASPELLAGLAGSLMVCGRGVGEDVSCNQCPWSESLLCLVIIYCFCNLEEELYESPKFLLSSPYQVCFLSGSHELQFRGNCCMTEDTQYINKWLFSNIKLKHKICVIWVSSVTYSWLLLVIRKTNCFLL